MIQPFIFTLFGSTGDLAQKKIMPSLLRLFSEGRLPQEFAIVAFSRRPWADADYHGFIKPSLEGIGEEDKLKEFFTHVVYAEGHFTEQAAFEKLHAVFEKLENKIGKARKYFYLSVQPEFYENILANLSATDLLKDATTRLMVEKPFGHDEASARELEAKFEKNITAEQLLRVDHYLAKEGLNVMVEQRKADEALESTLTHDYIQSIHVKIFEKIGIEGRGEFYERIGAIMDVGQNHAMEMLAMLMMDLAKDENDARAEVLHSLKAVGTPVLGQYEGYTDEDEVAENSQIETYFNIQLESSLPRWKGVAITLEGGKAMREKRADITIVYKDGAQKTFDIQATPSGRDAYEILIEEALLNNDDYFVSFDEVIGAWKALEPILKNRATLELKYYPKGTNGPTS